MTDKEETVPTAAVIAEKPEGDIELLWNKGNSATGIIKSELVRRCDVEKMIERTHGKLLDELKHASEEEKTGMDTLCQELLEEIQG